MWYKIKRILVGTQQVRPGVTETYTLSDVPTGDVNKYISIAKSWYKVTKVKFEYTNTIPQNPANNWVRISWNSNTTDRYWIWFTFTSSNPYIVINWHINNQSDTVFLNTSRNNWTNNVVFTIEREQKTLVCSWANTINQTYTMTGAEKNIVATIMNSATINVYSSRDNWWTVSDITITVTYEQN